MHFIEEASRRRPSCTCPRPCIRQNVCTSLRIRSDWVAVAESADLHTSKRMHFIEDSNMVTETIRHETCIRQNVCTSLRIRHGRGQHVESNPCIRQNVCTSLRRPAQARPHPPDEHRLHTSKRMHFIEEAMQSQFGCLSKGLHTSKRMHFIEEWWPCLG